MYQTILLALDVSDADRPIIDHVKQLASVTHSRVVLLHIATSAPAQYHREDSAGLEVKDDQAYLDRVKAEFESAGVQAVAELGYGDPATEIVKWVNGRGCDLVAMGTHGHKWLGDLLFGVTASRVQHNISVPVLLLRAK